jgi:hypothetical protein
MASYHCSVKVGSKGKAGPHASYISREGKYEKTRSNEKLEHVESGNMPKWAEKDPAQFWQAADQHERANGATYREIEVALPRELTPAQRVELVRDMVGQELGDKHAFTWAIHNPVASLEGREQPHAHIMYSERTIDGIDRDPEQYFKRYNAKNPEKGGCRKDSAGTEERLQETRERWAKVQNLHLEQHGHEARVDHRSLKDQGIERTPEPHFGPGRIQRMTAMQDVELTAVLERRAAEGEKERAAAELGKSIIDLSGDLRAAIAERRQVEMAKLQAEVYARQQAAQAAQARQVAAQAAEARQVAAQAEQARQVAAQAAEARQVAAQAAEARQVAAQAAEKAPEVLLQHLKAKLEGLAGRAVELRESDFSQVSGTVIVANQRWAAMHTGRETQLLDRQQWPVAEGRGYILRNGSAGPQMESRPIEGRTVSTLEYVYGKPVGDLAKQWAERDKSQAVSRGHVPGR